MLTAKRWELLKRRAVPAQFPFARPLVAWSFDNGVDRAQLRAASKRLPALIGHDFPSQMVKATRSDAGFQSG